MQGRIDFEAIINNQRRNTKKNFSRSRILILGDFSNRSISSEETRTNITANELPIYKIDLDNFNGVMARISPTVSFSQPMVDPGLHLKLCQIEDFHPDQIFDNVPVFERLKRIKSDITDPTKRPTALVELNQCFGQNVYMAEEKEATIESANPKPNNDSFQDLLQRGSNSQSVGRASINSKSSNNFIEKIIAPYINKENVTEISALEKQIESLMAQLMRNILHNAEFKALEATWRSLFNFLSDIENDDEIEFYILPLDKKSLVYALESYDHREFGDRESSVFQSRLEAYATQFNDDDGWALLLGDYQFEPNENDANVLLQLGKIAKASQAPFISAFTSGDVPFRNCISSKEKIFTDLWRKLRSTEYAHWISLISPSFIQRLPYGQNTDEIERFPFQEIEGKSPHEQLLWGNSSYLAAKMIINMYLMDDDDYNDINFMQFDDLPAYIYLEHGERLLRPCAEILLDPSAQNVLKDLGINPIISYSNRNSIRLYQLISLAAVQTLLSGKWS